MQIGQQYFLFDLLKEDGSDVERVEDARHAAAFNAKCKTECEVVSITTEKIVWSCSIHIFFITARMASNLDFREKRPHPLIIY